MLRLGFWSMPVMGPKGKLHLLDIINCIKLDIAAHPETTAFILHLPNTPAFGFARTPTGPEYLAATVKFQGDVVELLRETPGLLTTTVGGVFRKDAMYSTVRSLRIEFLLITSSDAPAACATGKAKRPFRSMFTGSSLFKLQSLPDLVDALPRALFRDWSKTLHAFEPCAPGPEMEKKQHFSGVSLHTAVLTNVIDGLNLNQENRLQVVDYTAWDDQLAIAVANLNAKRDRHTPTLAYVGVVWGGSQLAMRSANLNDSIQDYLLQCCRSDKPLGGNHTLRRASALSNRDESHRPRVVEESYEICYPRGLDLPIRQTMYDKWRVTPCTVTVKVPSPTPGGMPGEVQLVWADVVKTHDDEFNPSGVPYKARRPADTPIEVLDATTVDAKEWPVDAACATLEACKAAHEQHAVVAGSNPLIKWIVTGGGNLYMLAEADGELPADESLFIIRGQAKTGAAATKAMQEGDAWIQFKLDVETEVAMKFEGPMRGSFPTSPQPLGKVLKYLDDNQYVRFQLHLHKVTKEPGDSFVVESQEPACIDVKIIENQEMAACTMANIASYVSVPAMKACNIVKVVHKLQYNPTNNKITPGMAGLYPKDPVKVVKGKVYKAI